MPDLDPVLTVACPTCKADRGKPCISRRAVSVHVARRQVLTGLTARANAILRKADSPAQAPAQAPATKRRRKKRRANRRL